MIKKNVFFLIIDGLRADRLDGKQDNAKTPNLVKLVEKACIFDQAISTADGTTLALNTIFTSQFPFRTGTRAKEVYTDNSNYIHNLKNNGFSVYGVIPDLTSLSRFRFNFQNSVNSLKGTPPNIEHLWEGAGEKILQLFDNTKMKEPWFCYVHPMDLHDPLIVPKDFDSEKFGNSKYDRVLSAVDKWIGDIMDKIDFSTTTIVITADHGSIIPEGDLGYSDYEPELKTGLNVGKKIMPKSTHKIGAKMIVGLRNKIRDSRLKKANEGLTPYQIRSRLPYFRLTLFDEAIRVPLLFIDKDIPKKRILRQVTNMDIFPTIFDILGIDDSPKGILDGRSLVPILENKNTDELPAYFNTIAHAEITLDDKVGIRTSKYKYFRPTTTKDKEINLYDLENDPQENVNIADNNPEIVSKMEKILEDMTQDQDDSKINKIEIERLEKINDELKLLGYKKTWTEK